MDEGLIGKSYLGGMKWVYKLSVMLAAGLFVLHGLVPHVHGTGFTVDQTAITSLEAGDPDLFGFDLGENHLEFALVEAGLDLPAPAAVLLVLLVLPALLVQRPSRTRAVPIVQHTKLPGGFRGGFFRRPPPMK